jgi:hypothetical protein
MLRIVVAALLASITACTDAPAPAAHAGVTKVEPKPQGKPMQVDPNEELAIRVRRALEQAGKIDAPAIDIRAADGTVTLIGTAGTKDERERAAQVAGKVDGVKSVDNRLIVMRGS